MVSGIILTLHSTFACLWFVFTIPTYIWCYIGLRKHWHEQYFVKRRPMLLLILMTLGQVYSFNESVVPCLKIIFDHNKIISFILDTFYWILLTLTTFATSLYIIRIWLLYYDMQMSQLLKNRNWQVAINPDIIARNWYLNPNNQRRFGNDGRYIAYGLFILDTIAIIICVVLIYILHFDLIATIELVLWFLIQVECMRHNNYFVYLALFCFLLFSFSCVVSVLTPIYLRFCLHFLSLHCTNKTNNKSTMK